MKFKGNMTIFIMGLRKILEKVINVFSKFYNAYFILDFTAFVINYFFQDN